MIGIAMALAIIAAVGAVGWRRWQKARWARQQPGATMYMPVVVSRFDEIDAAIAGQVCWCEGTYVESGETSRNISERRYRIVRLVCNQCERERIIYFDVTAVFH